MIFEYDFYYFWSAGAVALAHGNVYDSVTLGAQMRGAGFPPDETPLYLHFPWVIWIYIGLSLLPFHVAQIGWYVAMVLSLAWIVKWFLNKSHDFPLQKEGRILFLFMAVGTFPPVVSEILWGQINAFLFVAFLFAMDLYERKREIVSGIVLSLTLGKPHLFLPIYGALGMYTMRRRRVCIPLGVGIGLFLQMGVSALLYPEGFAYFMKMIQFHSQESWHLTGSSFPQLLSQLIDSRSLPWLIALSGVVGGGWYGWKSSLSIRITTLTLIPWCLITAPYAWGHSFVLLIIQYLSWISEWRVSSDRSGAIFFFFSAVVGISLVLWRPLELLYLIFPFYFLFRNRLRIS